jgi:hypothetical protein
MPSVQYQPDHKGVTEELLCQIQLLMLLRMLWPRPKWISKHKTAPNRLRDLKARATLFF